jgi:hypothetical protein
LSREPKVTEALLGLLTTDLEAAAQKYLSHMSKEKPPDSEACAPSTSQLNY